MNIIQTATTDEFVRTAVQWLVGAMTSAGKDGKTVHVGLSGGSTPKPVYAKLSIETGIDWKRVRFFLTDERYVPMDHDDSNQRMVRSTLLLHAAEDASLLAPDMSLPLSECIAQYNQALSAIEPDVVILGMGDDGHIASLFPPVSADAFGPARVIHTTTDRFAIHDRISVTFPLLLKAKQRLFLISGAAKAALLQKMQTVSEDVSLYPAQYLFDERTTWIVGA